MGDAEVSRGRARAEDGVSEEAPRHELRLLGAIEAWSAGARVPLPRSKKTRALLAYLATTKRAHRRERLCALLWDVTDDPRGALRWSLSRLRHVFGEGEEILESDREQVAVRASVLRVDVDRLAAAVRRGVAEASLDELESLARLPRGEFLEGLELPDFMDFNAWCIAERERFREASCRVLDELVGRLRRDPARALPYARLRGQTDAFNVATQAALLELLLEVGKVEEARQRFESSRRLYREVGATGLTELEHAWRALLVSPKSAPAGGGAAGDREAAPAAPEAPPAPVEQPRTPPTATATLGPFIGRRRELAALEARLEGLGEAAVTVMTGEPGAGKSRLAERLLAHATSANFEVLAGRAYEAESSRPYGPWVDALRVDVQELLSAHGEEDAPGSREALFDAVSKRLARAAEGKRGVVLVLDDLQWLDRDSAELLHFVTRTYQAGPLFILLLARGGELADNEAVLRTLRSMRRERRVEELEIGPLSREEVAELVSRGGDADVDAIYQACAGNPLYAIELARARTSGVDTSHSTLLQLVRERVEQLPDHAADVLRWGAVLGHAIDIERLEALSSRPIEELVDALERLEHHALLRIDATRRRQRYVFSHDLVREAVYGELSHPRRRLMHRKVAQLLEPRVSEVAVATEVAHHAGLAGEALLGVRACVVAGNQSLRVFANADAEALAKRGLRLVEELDGADRITATLELLHVMYSARTPDREEAATRVRALAEQALDAGLTRAARLGFQMLSFLRWESSSMAAAHDNIMQAERVSRSADPSERTVALAQAAKCLVLLERNLGQAEAFVLEADALAHRAGRSTSAVCFAIGMIAAHRGELDAAVGAFREARELAREHGERLAEFCAVEHWVMAELDRERHHDALELAESLADLGGRVRKGAEGPAGRALHAFARVSVGQVDAEEELRAAIEELRVADAKYELSFLLTRWAAHELARGRTDEAKRLGELGLEVARAIGRASERAFAHLVLRECAEREGVSEAMATHRSCLDELMEGELSQTVRARVAATLDRAPGRAPRARGGARPRSR
jgi:DNA-binding SARP family transcriptional activator/tetratricopeptide (TPR) repeat protein